MRSRRLESVHSDVLECDLGCVLDFRKVKLFWQVNAELISVNAADSLQEPTWSTILCWGTAHATGSTMIDDEISGWRRLCQDIWRLYLSHDWLAAAPARGQAWRLSMS